MSLLLGQSTSKLPLSVHSESDREAASSLGELKTIVERMLDANHDLCRRLDKVEAKSIIGDCACSLKTTTEDTDDTETIKPAHGYPGIADRSISHSQSFHFEFESVLQASRVYSKANLSECDVSFKSSVVRSRAWSLLSDISLAQISIVSVIALPVYPNDISNRNCYIFGDIHEVINTSTCKEQPDTTQTVHTTSSQMPDAISTSGSIGQVGSSTLGWGNGNEEDAYPCKGCGDILEEGEAFELGESRNR